MSAEAQRGLFGELHFLREVLLPGVGAGPAAGGWKGGEQAHQDFQLQRGAVEVKTTLAKQPQVVRITSERQLDDGAAAALFLHVVALDVRDGGGETLPAMVASLRDKLTVEAAAREAFEDGLLAYGYLDVHASKYADSGYVVRSQSSYRVKRGFPRIVERNLPAGVGDASYGLAVVACAAFAVSAEEVGKALGEPRVRTGKSGRKS
jgi:hypothetical protein